MNGVLYLVQRLHKWDDFEPSAVGPFPVSVHGPEGSVGFMPIFEREEDALAWAEGSPVSRVTLMEPGR